MTFSTHNSGTGEKLVWWQRPFSALLNVTARCQSMTIKEQLDFGVKFFNLQITKYKNEWVFSHGLCIYDYRLFDALSIMDEYATTEKPIYYQLYLDKNFLLKQDNESFKTLVDLLKVKSDQGNVKIVKALIEGSNELCYKSNMVLNCYESYWTKSWAKCNAKSWIDLLPLPKRWAKLHNQEAYEQGLKYDYFMGDFINEFITYVNNEQDVNNELEIIPSNTPSNVPSIKPSSTPTPTPTSSLEVNVLTPVESITPNLIPSATPTVVPSNTPIITPDPTIDDVIEPTPTSYFAYTFNIFSKGTLTHNSSVPVYANATVDGDVFTNINLTTNSKYVYVDTIDNINGKSTLNNELIGYIHSNGKASANYRIVVSGNISTSNHGTFSSSLKSVIYGKKPEASPTPTPSSYYNGLANPTSSPIMPII